MNGTIYELQSIISLPCGQKSYKSLLAHRPLYSVINCYRSAFWGTSQNATAESSVNVAVRNKWCQQVCKFLFLRQLLSILLSIRVNFGNILFWVKECAKRISTQNKICVCYDRCQEVYNSLIFSSCYSYKAASLISPHRHRCSGRRWRRTHSSVHLK